MEDWDMIDDPHNCTSFSISQDHRKLNYKIISDNIKTFVNSDASTKAKVDYCAHTRKVSLHNHI